ncbi:hypothetical protein [Haloarchaeobius iranensis]|uniref:Uncharacterized protein n=1 Tax=Haloarchaeobius iranensis TaxID=996166 RepID=A0A1G9UFR8_9EURY|nr:hypothetical protein [Haloarchaeobius iranensis]SDM58790.1 hypothetical protein SAMN05192554_104105 [Haloarchaeobius iranensis]
MTDTNDSDDSSNGWFTARRAFLALFTLSVLSMVAVQPVMAQSDSVVCEAPSSSGGTWTTTGLGDLVERFFQITTLVGLIGMFAIWQGGSLAEILTLSQRQKRNIKEYKSSSLKAAITLVLIGPIFTVVGSSFIGSKMSCLDLTSL